MLDVEQPLPFTLKRPPLAQAIAQVQFPQIARLTTLAGIAPVQDALLDTFPYMQQVDIQEMQISFGPGGANPQATSNKVTQFNDEQGWSLEVTAGSATLVANKDAYGSSEVFADRLSTTLLALSKVRGLSRCNRLGVRYVNLAPVLEGSDRWHEWFQSELLGWARPELLASDSTLIAMIAETRVHRRLDGPLAWASRVESVVRHGLAPMGSVVPLSQPQPLSQTSYLLDLDIYVTEAQTWESGALVEQYVALHAEIEKFFFWALTKRGKEHFGAEVHQHHD